MSAAIGTKARSGAGNGSTASAQSYLFVPILLLFALFVIAVIRSPSLVTNAGIGSAIIVAAPLILASYALTFIVMAGRGGVDLSIGPLIGFINVTLVTLFEAKYIETGFQFFAYAIAVGIAYQLLMGLIIVYVRIQPIIVALSGYLTLAGLNLMIMKRPGGTAPVWMSSWGLGESIWSPVLVILIIATGFWFLFTRTAFGDHLRLMGSEERTAYASGVNITAVRLGAHVIAGVYAGLTALTFTSLISSGDPTQGSTYTLMAVTALVLGGTSLAGGRGSIIGSLLGAVNIYLITYVLATFNFGKIQSFVTQLAYGLILVVALLLTIFLPQIQRATRSLSPIAMFVFLGLISFGVILYAKDRVRVAQFAASQQSVGVSLAGQSLSEQAGTSLAGESLSGQSLAGESLSGQSLAGESLSGQSLSAQAAAEEQSAAEPTGTPVVVAVVIIAIGLYLIYLLYAHLNLFTLTFVGVVILLLIGYGAYDGALTEAATAAQAAVPRLAIPAFFDLLGPSQSSLGMETTVFSSMPVAIAAIAVGAVLLGTVLIFTTVPQASGRVSEIGLWFMVAAAAVATAFVVYENNVLNLAGGGTFNGVLTPVLIGALLFIVTLPAFQRRVRNITALMILLLSVTGLGGAFFATVPRSTTVEATAAPAIVAPAPLALPATVPELPAIFYLETFAVIAVAIIVFLLTITGARNHILQNVRVQSGAEGVSYLGIFIAVTASLGLGAVFIVAGIPIWKFIVALIASVIAARFLFAFLVHYRSRGGMGGGDIGMGRQVG